MKGEKHGRRVEHRDEWMKGMKEEGLQEEKGKGERIE